MHARWPDGSLHQITDITWAQLEAAARAEERGSAKKKSLWAGDHQASGLGVTVDWRPDREMLCSVYLAKKQVCQAALARFATEADVIELMIGLAKDLCSGKLNVCDLYKERDVRAAEEGVNLKARAKKHGGAEATAPTEACVAACKPAEVAACKPVEVAACRPTEVVKWMDPLPDAIFGD